MYIRWIGRPVERRSIQAAGSRVSGQSLSDLALVVNEGQDLHDERSFATMTGSGHIYQASGLLIQARHERVYISALAGWKHTHLPM